MKTKLFFYLMLLIGLNNYAQTINVSTGVSSTGLPVSQNTPDPYWKIVAGPGGFIPQQATVVPTYTFNWQPTPISGTNAQWLNNVTNYISIPGNYVYERSFNVTSGTTNLNCNFGVAFDDTLISLELVPPTGATIPLTVVSSNFYSISNMIVNSISSPAVGTWKIRATINYFDDVGGFMLSGYIDLANNSCNTTTSDFNNVFYGLAYVNNHSIDDTIDLQVHSYTFSVNTQKTICSIGYKAQPEMATRTYEIKITDVGNNAVVYDDHHLFSTITNSYVTPSSPVTLYPGRVYKLERIQNNYAGTPSGLLNTIGRVVHHNSFSPITFPQSFGNINVLGASAYDVNANPVFLDNFIPYIDIRFQAPNTTPTTTIQNSVCGTTIPTLGSLVSAVSVNGATSYMFEVTDTTTGLVQTITRNVPNFQLSSLADYQYSTTYNIRVKVLVNGVWGNYGTACSVLTPNLVSPTGVSQVTSTQCGTLSSPYQLSSISALISTTSTAYVTGYRFRITNMSTGEVQWKERNVHFFNLTSVYNPSVPANTNTLFNGSSYVNGISFNYGTIYKVEVAMKTTTPFPVLPLEPVYGHACYIKTPDVPSLTTACGTIIPSKTTNILTTSLAGVTQYRFLITKLDATGNPIVPLTQLVITHTNSNQFYFNLNEFLTLPGFYSMNTQYKVEVAVMTSGTWSPYSTTSCIITSPPIPRMMQPDEDKTVFEAIASPNPFDNSIELTLESDSKEDVQLVVYDIFGKIIEQKQIPSSELAVQEIGRNYASGMYIIHLKQGANNKTIKVIKK
ncbi:MAG TPA: T9SS type A sorting domain-containing protein [Flavobacterium lutivivi]|nr:T9SS type A sorting domain-containing protein [Flavobacterium lutivivi]